MISWEDKTYSQDKHSGHLNYVRSGRVVSVDLTNRSMLANLLIYSHYCFSFINIKYFWWRDHYPKCIFACFNFQWFLANKAYTFTSPITLLLEKIASAIKFLFCFFRFFFWGVKEKMAIRGVRRSRRFVMKNNSGKDRVCVNRSGVSSDDYKNL